MFDRRFFTTAMMMLQTLAVAPICAEEEALDPDRQEALDCPAESFYNLREIGNIDTIKTKMMEDVDAIAGVLEAGYAPSDWKEEHVGWTLDDKVADAKEKIAAMEPLTVKGYHQVLRDFFNAMEDYHVNVGFYSTERASLPFIVKGAEGRYFIHAVDRSGISPNLQGFINQGDEILFFDGRPVHEVITELRDDSQRKNRDDTDYGMAEFFLTHRVGAQGADVPRGPVNVVLRGRSGRAMRITMNWRYTPEMIANHTAHLNENKGLGLEGSEGEEEGSFASFEKFLSSHSMMVSPVYSLVEKWAPEMLFEGNFIGSRESYLPDLGTKVWESHPRSPFKAYIFLNQQNRLVGYVRISSYMAGGREAQAFGQLMQQFQARTDMLVIDQLHNPGGSIFYAYALISMLSDKPISVPKHHVKINQSEVEFALQGLHRLQQIQSPQQAYQELGQTFGGLHVTKDIVDGMREYFQFMISEWNSGKDLTAPIGLLGVDTIQPHPHARYTKPILMLADHMSLSCGDFVPATLKDNKRVTLLGSTTAGAGGFVLEATYPNRFGMQSMHYTGSLAERKGGDYIEGLGIDPDIEYTPTAEDLRGGYRGFVEVINRVLGTMNSGQGPIRR